VEATLYTLAMVAVELRRDRVGEEEDAMREERLVVKKGKVSCWEISEGPERGEEASMVGVKVVVSRRVGVMV
jgi:hypothetical protein